MDDIETKLLNQNIEYVPLKGIKMGEILCFYDYVDAVNGSEKARLRLNKWLEITKTKDVQTMLKSVKRAMINAYKSIDKQEQKEYLQTNGYIYVIKHETKDCYKIGKTIDFNKRLTTFNVSLPFNITPTITYYVKDYSKVELELHKTYSAKRLGGEWFSLDAMDLLEIETYLKNIEVIDNAGITHK